MPTRLEIEEEVVRIASQMDPDASMVPVPIYGTIADDGTTITFPELDRGTVPANRFDARLIKVAEDATAVDFSPAVTVSGAHTAATTSLTVSSATDIRVGYVLELNASEKVLVRAIVGAVLTVTRAYNGTTAAAYTGGETAKYDPYGVVTGVDDGGFAAGGVLTISPNFASTTGELAAKYGAGSFFLYPRGWTPYVVVEEINKVLRLTDAPFIWFPSLVTDPSFESDDLANWDEVGAGVTSLFSTTALSSLFGERQLAIVCTVAATGVETENIRVHEGENLLVSAHFLDVTDMSCVLQDVTNTVALRTVTLEESAWTEARFTEAVPADCKLVAVRFLSTSTAGSAIVSSPVIVQSNRQRTYVAPSWFNRQSQFIGAIEFPQGYATDQADAFTSLSRMAEEYSGEVKFLRSDRDLNPLRVEMSCHGNRPVALIVKRAFAELAGDSSNTVADKDYVANKVVANILRRRAQDKWKGYAAIARDRASMLGYGGRSTRVEESLTYV